MIKDKAQRVCFFVNNGEYLRMICFDDDHFVCEDERSGEMYDFRYDEVVEDEITYFMELTKIV